MATGGSRILGLAFAPVLAMLIPPGPPANEPAPRAASVLDWLSSAPVRSALERLLERAQYGASPYESAAWLVRTPSGVAVEAWDFTREFHRACWHGGVPHGALAIVHTHPNRVDPRPSPADVALAQRLGIPVYALTREGLWAAHADGTIVLEARGPRSCTRLACLP